MSDEHWTTTPPWREITIPASELPQGDNKLRQVLAELDPVGAPRYKRTANGTSCNIFVWDFTRAMGCEIPHWVRADGRQSQVGKGRELNANGICRWLKTAGPREGWVGADRKTAVDAAARGHVVVLGWDSGNTSPGHVAVMLPEGTIAQTGATHFVGKTVREGFGTKQPEFFIFAPGAHRA
jgi:hypothetical protein